MLTAEHIKGLKQRNVSVNADKTMERMKKDYSAALRPEKTAIIALSGQGRPTFYRAFTTGSASARLILAMSQILKISPFYYTGEHDKREPSQDAYTLLFLNNHGYQDLVEELSAKLKPSPPRPQEPAAPPPPPPDKAPRKTEAEADKAPREEAARDDGAILRLDLPDSPGIRQCIEEMDDGDAGILLRSLLIRGRAGGQAAEYAALVKRLLLI
ncbi:MAG: hypothetical protein FWG93_00340 [Oscillospiraceae bacterium]|nr:hypothetical protein [Oscillospiraceae bacterium]